MYLFVFWLIQVVRVVSIIFEIIELKYSFLFFYYLLGGSNTLGCFKFIRLLTSTELLSKLCSDVSRWSLWSYESYRMPQGWFLVYLEITKITCNDNF